MKKYTQAEFDAIPRDDHGVKHCPTGDYSAIKYIPEWCRFAEGCKCEFGEIKRLFTAGGFGSVGRTTYFWLITDGSIHVRCGCFTGTLDDWQNEVKETYGDSSLAKAYLALVPAVVEMSKSLENGDDQQCK